MRKIRVGITGGIGTGKSLFSSFMEENGYRVIIADEISKKLMNENEQLKKRIIQEFGRQSYREEELNRKYLAQKVFSDLQKLKKINSLVHPPTIEEIKRQMKEALKRKKLVFVESAIIYDVKIESLFDYVILLTSSEENKIKRITERDNAIREDVEKRISNQLPDKIKKGKADFVIENDGTREELKSKAEFVLSILEQM